MTAQPLNPNARDSVRVIAALIKDWISLATPGVVWVRYQSDVSRDLMLSLAAPRIPRVAFEPPQPQQAAQWLETSLASFPGTTESPGVVAVLFPPIESGTVEENHPLWEAFRNLNLRRESIFSLPLVQIWCVPAALAARAQMEAPDLASWFRLKFWLDELPQPGAWTDSLIPSESSAKDLRDLASSLPKETIALREMKVAVGRRRLAAVAPDDVAGRAHILNDLSIDLSAVGKREEALGTAQESVELRRKLAKGNPDAFLPDLAMSLNSLANRQSEVGKREEALGTAQEAVELRRKLAKGNPDAFLPDLAASLNNLANRQSEVGKREEALGTAQEAVESYRKLAKGNPDAFLPDLAASLNNLAAMQSEVGKREEALGTAQEAVELYRKLAKGNPDAFLPDLAMSLNNLATMQSEVGKREEALGTAQEAVELRRKLAKGNPDAFLPDLAMSLNNLAIRQSAVGKREEALGTAQEAVELRRKLAKGNPDAFLPDLAASLNNLAMMQSEVGKREEALGTAQEAVELRRKLAKGNPDAFLPDLAMSLAVLGKCQMGLDQPKDAVESYRESIATLAPFFLDLPSAHAGLIVAMARDYIAACEKCGQSPEIALLAPIVEVLQRIQQPPG